MDRDSEADKAVEQQQQPVDEEPEVVQPVPDVKSFKTSSMQQAPELKEYLESLLKDPFNTFCIDTKQDKSTHCIVWLGAFVCEESAKKLVSAQGGQQHCYVKDVYKEQWDDYQLKSLAHGGNANLFNFLKEYKLENQSVIANYNTPALKWYRAAHQAKMDGVPFTKPKPPKDWDEALQRTQTTLIKGFNDNFSYATKVIGEKSYNIKESVQKGQAYNKLKEQSINASATVAQRTSDLRTQVARSDTYKKINAGASHGYAQASVGAASLKQKVQSQQFAKNLMGMFGQKKQMIEEPGRASDYVEEQKEEEDPQSLNPSEVKTESADEKENDK